MRKEETGVETFITEDLLVSLGAIRMALSWVEADGAKGSEQARSIGISRVDDELAALQLRAREVSRAMRYEMRTQAVADVATAPKTVVAEDHSETPHWRTDADAQPQKSTPEKIDDTGMQSRPASPRRNGELGHSIDELLISALSDQKEGPTPTQGIRTQTG